MDTTNPLSITMPEPLGPREKFPKITGNKEPKDSADAKALGNLIVAPADLTGKGFTPLIQTAQQAGVVAEKRYEEQEKTQFIDVVKAKAINDTFLGTAARNFVAERFADKPDPNHRVDPKDLAGFTEKEQAWLNASVNTADLEARKFDLMDYREQSEIGERMGPWVGFAAGMMAGLPEGVASGNLVARGFAGLKAAKSLSMELAEQAVGNVGLVAIQSSFDTHVSETDYAMALALSGISGVLGVHSSHADGGVLKEVDRLQKVADTAAEEHVSTLKKAADNLGEGATTEQIKVEADRLEANNIKTATNTGELPEDRHILPLDDTTIRTDVKEEVKAGAGEGPSGPVAPPKMAEGTDTPPVETTGIRGPALPKELAGAKPRWKTFDIEFASDVDRALFIVSQKTKSKADAAYRDWLKEQGLTDADIAQYSRVIRDNLKKAEKDATSSLLAHDTTESLTLRLDAAVDSFTNTKEARAAFEKAGMTTQETSGMRELYAQPGIGDMRLQKLDNSPEWQAQISKLTGGEYTNSASLPKDGPRLRLTQAAEASGMLPAVVKAYNALLHMLPEDHRIILTVGALGKENGSIISLGNIHIISLNVDAGRRGVEVLRTAAHEFGHAVYHAHAAAIPAELRAKMTGAYLKFLQNAGTPVNASIALNQRVSPTNARAKGTSVRRTGYDLSRDEFTAEQFVKWMERENAKGSKEYFTLPERMVQVWNDLVNAVLSTFNAFKQKQLITPEESFAEFFQGVAKKGLMGDTPESVPAKVSIPGLTENDAGTRMNSPTALAHGLHLLPVDTPSKQAEVQAMVHMYEKADRLAPQVDETRLSKLMNTALFSGGQAAANTMLRSANTLVRWVASELLESPGGAGGRRSTAAIAKHITERRMMGNTLNEVQTQYETFRKAQGVSAVDDYWGGKTWQRFNRMVAEEIESRKAGAAGVESPAEVVEAANSIEKAFDRIRMDQVNAKSVGWASLPESSVGYMPHRMSPEKVINMTMAQKEALHSALTDQFITIEGWDMTFADALASKYLNQVERRALGGFDAPVGVHQTGAADIVEEALQAMGMDKEQVTLTMKKFMQAGPGYTKRRIRLDLNQSHTLSDGTEFKLMDLFDTDMFSLIRAQAGRASGEVALARHGIMGKAHLRLIREAMMQGDNKSRATARELQAFDQVAAEFLNEPFGTQNKWVDRVMQFNSLARLGGMGFTQAAESINGMVSVGIARTFASIGSMKRMRNEILTLAKGEKVNNPILSSIEQFSGAEFGTDAYKIVFPFDNGSLQHQTYGSDSITHADRLLRGGAHMQGKLSFWRAFHSTQQRGFAEQIVRKAFEYVKAGTNDAALRDMGITEELAMNLRAEMDGIATFNGNKLASLDITKMENVNAANEFVQAIHRGTSQIIQDTFIGEKGAWAHEGMARLMTQFRTFSLTSIEKQWARQRGNVGTAGSLGIIMAAMAAATPLYMARTYVQSIGRKDQQAYLEQRLSFYNLARATMNYVAATGLAGDFLDAGQAVTGAEFMGNERGNAGGAGAKRFIGNMVAPALGTADDLWKAVQNTKTGTDPTELLKVMPGSRLPYVMPAINALGN